MEITKNVGSLELIINDENVRNSCRKYCLIWFIVGMVQFLKTILSNYFFNAFIVACIAACRTQCASIQLVRRRRKINWFNVIHNRETVLFFLYSFDIIITVSSILNEKRAKIAFKTKTLLCNIVYTMRYMRCSSNVDKFTTHLISVIRSLVDCPKQKIE